MKKLKAFTSPSRAMSPQGERPTLKRRHDGGSVGSGGGGVLCEGTCHHRKVAFTLAEVLITLGVIGVVAALTIPTIMANIQGKQFAAQFKKTISTLNNAVRMNQANYDFNFADAAGYIDNSWGFARYKTLTPENSMTFWAIFNGSLKGTWYDHEYTCEELHLTEQDDCYPGDTSPHTYIIKSANGDNEHENYFYMDNGHTEYLLNDGSIVTFDALLWAGDCTMTAGMSLRDALLGNGQCMGEGACLTACGGYIDVNGPSGPNREVKCKDGQTTSVDLDEPCEVNAASMGDVFPIVYFDSTVAPATNASKYVFEHYK